MLEELKARSMAAANRLVAAQARLALAQQEVQSAQLEVNVWGNAVNIEAREEAARAAEAARNQIPITLGPAVEATDVEAEAPADVQPEEGEEPVNKTQLVRDLLLQNHSGMTPAAIWSAFHEQAPNASRNYLYSVLKRLRDNEEVTQRRGKYVLKSRPIPEHKEGLFVN